MNAHPLRSGDPCPAKSFPEGHQVRTAAQAGRDRLKNGDLLNAVEAAGFDLLLTTDRNLPSQQKLEGRRIAVVVLSRQQWPELRPHVQLVVEALRTVEPGRCIEVEIPPPVKRSAD